jgi:2-C-methyl-D-erythritol 4-phosphate cytidylyltransferase/2-C-methyl-D-erythritol 2,4-cyclodiphosphate synthase
LSLSALHRDTKSRGNTVAVVAAVIVAAGRGARVGGQEPKQFRPFAGQTALRMTLERFAGHSGVSLVQPVIHPDDRERYADEAAGLTLLPPVSGGTMRQESVRAGLDALAPKAPDIVLVHDAARPFASHSLISRSIAAAGEFGAAIPALEVSDAVKLVDGAGAVTDAVERNKVRLCKRRRRSALCVFARRTTKQPVPVFAIFRTTRHWHNGRA